MLTEKITLLLSSHRHPSNPAMPLALTRYQIVSLLRSSLSPNEEQQDFEAKVLDALHELQAQGEILAGTRNCYCMAPPSLVLAEQENLTGLLFRGDRAYLHLAHQALHTQQNSHNPLQLDVEVQHLHRMKECLSKVGIRLLTVDDSVERLPSPRKPKSELRSPWSADPFSINWEKGKSVRRYIPGDAVQKDRWQECHHKSLKNQDLLKIPTGEYLWFEEPHFYELEPDVAILAMFERDKETGFPIKIPWDKAQGKLNLQGIILQSAYARWLWALSKPDSDHYRTRYFQPANRHLVEAAFNRLGCVLV
ncbi:hypothetical protein H6F96_00165 [Microcoleus sp. FACHB-53]|nr:hypothetical protein [Microcoleus sp. FACHB-53]